MLSSDVINRWKIVSEDEREILSKYLNTIPLKQEKELAERANKVILDSLKYDKTILISLEHIIWTFFMDQLSTNHKIKPQAEEIVLLVFEKLCIDLNSPEIEILPNIKKFLEAKKDIWSTIEDVSWNSMKQL